MGDEQATMMASLRIAQESLEEANAHRRVAIDAVVDYALRAFLEGEDLELVMEACGFKRSEGEGPSTFLAMLGVQAAGGARERFATWLGQAVLDRIMRDG